MTTETAETYAAWQAVVLDADGFVLSDEHIRGWADTKDEDRDAEYIDDGEPNELMVVRGTANPTPQYEGSDVLRQEGTYETWDVLYEQDLYSEEPADVVALWERAQAVAQAVNAAGVS